MLAMISFLLLFVASEEVKGMEVGKNRQKSLVPRYVSSLITQQNALDPSRYHDVVMLRLERTPGSSLFDDISEEILKNNPNYPMFTHTSMGPIPPFRIHAASFFVITTDMATDADNASFIP